MEQLWRRQTRAPEPVAWDESLQEGFMTLNTGEQSVSGFDFLSLAASSCVSYAKSVMS